MAGFELPVGIEIFRGRYVEELREARAAQGRARSSIIAGRCPTSNHVFLPGHRIMVQVQSSLVPALRPQPADVRPEHFLRKAGDYRRRTADLPWRTTPSAVLLPIVP